MDINQRNEIISLCDLYMEEQRLCLHANLDVRAAAGRASGHAGGRRDEGETRVKVLIAAGGGVKRMSHYDDRRQITYRYHPCPASAPRNTQRQNNPLQTQCSLRPKKVTFPVTKP